MPPILQMNLLLVVLAQAAGTNAKTSQYWASYSGYLSTMLDDTFANRTGAFVRPRGMVLAEDVGVENDGANAPWFVSNANVSSVGGMTKLYHAP